MELEMQARRREREEQKRLAAHHVAAQPGGESDEHEVADGKEPMEATHELN